MKTIEIKYDIGQPVKIKEINIVGHVDSLSINDRGIMYRVVYWYNGKRESVWMYAREIAAAIKSAKITISEGKMTCFTL